MAFGVKGQYFLNFKFGENSDFIDKEDLVDFTVFEYAGNLLPTFKLNFRTQDESVITRLNEGNNIQAQMGRTQDDLIDVTLNISSVKHSKDGSDFVYFETSGFASEIDYVTDHTLRITPEQSAIETIIQVANENGFTVDSNVQSSNDSQKWIQPNVSSKVFVNDTYMRSDLGDSALGLAITADGKFILRDILEHINRPSSNRYDWKFTKNPQGPNEIAYSPEMYIESQSGFINNWLGYGRNIKLINNETGEVQNILDQPDVILALTNQLDKKPSISDQRYGGSRFQNTSVHENFWSSYNHNLIFLTNLSKIENVVHFGERFFLIRPLDLVMYAVESTASNKISSEYTTGLYMASGVIRKFQSNAASTSVILNREAFNNVRVNA